MKIYKITYYCGGCDEAHTHEIPAPSEKVAVAMLVTFLQRLRMVESDIVETEDGRFVLKTTPSEFEVEDTGRELQTEPEPEPKEIPMAKGMAAEFGRVLFDSLSEEHGVD